MGNKIKILFVNENIVGDYVLVDFSGIDDYGNFYGDCVMENKRFKAD
ncbi:MAG: hypothetical protein IJZ29_04635 [Clostridia bacterium]|nr:hypothetical protein [Clostridia bacterium]